MNFNLLWQNNCFNLTKTSNVMQQNQLPLTNNNLPLYTNFLYSIGLEERKNDIISPNTSYHTDISDSANSFFERVFNWEYFSNELEFE